MNYVVMVTDSDVTLVCDDIAGPPVEFFPIFPIRKPGESWLPTLNALHQMTSAITEAEDEKAKSDG